MPTGVVCVVALEPPRSVLSRLSMRRSILAASLVAAARAGPQETCQVSTEVDTQIGACASAGQIYTLKLANGDVVGEFSSRFIRENTNEAFDLSSHQREDLVENSVGVVAAEQLMSDKATDEPLVFKVNFTDGHTGTFQVPQPSQARWSAAHELPRRERKLWGLASDVDDGTTTATETTGMLGKDGPLRFSYADLCGSASRPESRARWVEAMHTWGISIIEGMPGEVDETIRFSKCVAGYELPTVYGHKFKIESVDKPNNLAYSNAFIQQHTDLPFYSTPPGVQLFHCFRPAAEGGESMFLDGFQAAQTLFQRDPAAFKVLTETPVRHFDLTETWHLSKMQRTLLLDEAAESPRTGQMPTLQRVHFNERTRDSWRSWEPHQAEAQNQLYQALKAYERIVDEESRYVIYRLQPGEMVATDNHRVMHARKSFRGARYFEGAYIEWDALHAAWRVVAANTRT
eukprot:TRINITY_DN3196_c0_g1_i1.p1 TRINITY_DN3196_c0_g1~~TRINITY_DN3196_c0_g1_i1.p1  ORF type:complete len:459 (-),score=78.58 TRINITY_DN3196_c0_g1_i1:278-1654(-)